MNFDHWGELAQLSPLAALEGFRTLKGNRLILPDGTVAAIGTGKYLKLPLDKIADFDFDEQDWKIVPSDKDPERVEW